ncbi:MAG: hypothetical protein GY869_30870, partial [Planctomycetes bacterium]|nr:hypothetical protein [Planctomycetota bacterium]
MLRKKMVSSLIIFLCVAFVSAAAAEEIKFARFPNISHGKIVFSYHGDLWLVDDDGSNPRQLTDHSARDEYPRFSPDGKQIAFSSNRMGNNDIWVMPTEGGPVQQVTFHTTNDTMLYWTPEGDRILFATSRGAMQWASPLYTVPLDGGIPEPIEMGMGAYGMFSQDGRMLAFNRVSYRHPKKNYNGSSAANIWVMDTRRNNFRKLTNIVLEEYHQHCHDAYPMCGADRMIYFMSERSGKFNIWRISPRGGDPEQVTFHTTDGVQFPSISPDGRTIVYSNEFELWTLSVPEGTPKRITIDIPYKPEDNLVQYLPTENVADGFAPNLEGDYVAVDFHGEIFAVPAEAGVGEMKQITNAEWRERAGLYSPDGKYLAYYSDESGDDEIWLYDIAAEKPSKLTTQSSKKAMQLWSQDSRDLLFTANNRIYLAAIPDGKITEVAYNQAGGFQNIQFSPDGEWLVYSRSNDEQDSEVFLYDIVMDEEYNITQHPGRDRAVAISGDQKTVIFVSNRGNGVNHLYAIPLEKITIDEDDPLYKERINKASDRRSDRAETKEELDLITIDMDNIKRRTRQLTTGSTGVGTAFLSADGKVIYYTMGGGGGTRGGQRGAAPAGGSGAALHAIGIDGKNQRKIADGSFSQMKLTPDGKTIFYREQNGIFRMGLDNKKKEQVNFSFTVFVDKKKEWVQMFDEFYRHWKYSYVEEDMLGFDWDAIRDRYEPMVDYVGETQDFWDLAAEMLYELKSSHSGASGPRNAGQTMQRGYTTRLLGFEMIPNRGRYRVSHIYRDGPADKDWVDIAVGDYVLAIDDQVIKYPDNYWKILNKKLNEYATLE